MCCFDTVYSRSDSGCSALVKGVKSWYVSHHGEDRIGCGKTPNNACRSINYTAQFLEWADTLLIDGQGSEQSPYEITCGPNVQRSKTVGLTFNISVSIEGYNSQVYIAGSEQNCTLLSFNGAGMSKRGESMVVMLKNITIAHTTAEISDGVITACNSALLVMSCSFMNNKRGHTLIFILNDNIDDIEYRLLVSNSTFFNNSGAIMVGMPLTKSVRGCVDIILTDSEFQQNAPNGALVIQNIGTIPLFSHTENVTFQENQHTSGGAVHIKSSDYVQTTESTFTDLDDSEPFCVDDGYSPSNDVLAKENLETRLIGPVFWKEDNSTIEVNVLFKSVRFIANAAKGMGGGVYASVPYSTSLTFDNVCFQGNAAGDQTGRGGAAYVSGGHIYLISSQVLDNTAPFLAGAWYNDYSTSYFEIRNTTFKNSISCPSTHTGELLFSDSRGPIVISNSTFEVDTATFQDITVLFHEGEGNFTILNSSVVSCSKGYNLTVIDSYDYGTNNVSFTCTPCPAKTYSLERAYSYGNKHVNGVNCLPCPHNGNCDNTNVVPRPNNWGFTVEGTPVKVEFAYCPSGRCCTSQDRDQCLNYNSCPHNRSGTLCSHCKSGHISVLGSTKCIEEEHCQEYSETIMITCTITIAVFFLIFLICKVTLTKWIFNGLHRLNLKDQLSNKVLPLENVVESQPIDEEDEYVTIENGSTKSKTMLLSQISNISWEGSDDYVKMLFFFYQAADLVIFDRSTNPSSYRESMENFVVKLFNFRAVPPVTAVCIREPEDIWPFTSNSIYKNGRFFILLLILVIITHVFFLLLNKAGRKCSRQTLVKKTSCILKHVARASVTLCLLGYVVVARGTFKRCDCTNVDTYNILTYFGSGLCDYWLWYLVSIYLWTGVMLFWLNIFVLTFWIERKKFNIGPIQFLLLAFIPFPFNFIWTIWMCFKRRRCVKTSKLKETNADHMEFTLTALEVLQAPFKTDYRRYWEVVLILSRLVMVLCYFEIRNILLRSLMLILVCAIFAVMHTLAQPFKRKTANRAMMMSLILLVLIAALNTLDVLSHSYVTSFADPEGTLELILEWVEFVLIMLPAAVLMIVALLSISVNVVCWAKTHKLGKNKANGEGERLLEEDPSERSIESPHPVKRLRFNEDSNDANRQPSQAPRKSSPSVLIDSGYQSESTCEPIICQDDAEHTDTINTVEEGNSPTHRNSVDFTDEQVLLHTVSPTEETEDVPSGAGATNTSTIAEVHDSSKGGHYSLMTSSNDPNSEVHNWREDQAYLLACLNQFGDILNGLPDRSLLSSTNFTTNIFAGGEFDNEGGHLTIEQAGVNLFIPPGALLESEGPKRLFICVSTLDREYPSLRANQTALTPVVRCGPHGLKFQKHVLLSMKHCLNPSEISTSLKLLASDTDLQQPTDWYNASDTGKVLCISQGDDTISFTNTLKTFSVVCDITTMRFRVGCFITNVSQRSSKLRVRLWRATAADTEIANVKEQSLRGQKVGSDSECVLHKNGKCLRIKMKQLCKNWVLLDDLVKVIPSELIWQQSHNIGPSVAVTYLLQTPKIGQRGPLSANITVTDETETSVHAQFDLKDVE